MDHSPQPHGFVVSNMLIVERGITEPSSQCIQIFFSITALQLVQIIANNPMPIYPVRSTRGNQVVKFCCAICSSLDKQHGMVSKETKIPLFWQIK